LNQSLGFEYKLHLSCFAKRELTVTVRVRIAPSPTGNLHIGTARTAVFNWLFARHHGGKFILRIEDTDLERSRPEYTDNILEGLRWLGLNWDEGPFFQSQRLDLYKEAVQKLLEKGLAYRCYTTSEELEALREAQKARGEAPRYDNRHRNLTPEQRAAFEAEGRSSVIRFKIEDGREIVWNDLVRGKMSWRGNDLGGDMVIARASEEGSGQPLYNFVVVVDDIDMQITHVIRGEDHIANTAKQILLYEAMGAKIPEFSHTPLILNMEGRKLSKRDGVTSISDFQKMGFIAEGLVNYMTLLGWSPPDSTQEIFTLETAAKEFGFERVNKAGAKFDWDKLDWLNSQYIHKTPVDKLTDLLIPFWEAAGYKFDGGRERPWLEQLVTLISQSLTRLVNAVPQSQLFFSDTVEFSEEGSTQLKQEGSTAVLEAIVTALENQPQLSEAAAQDIIKQVVKEQKVKKGLVMRSLRAALTGDVHGPDLIQSWLLLNQIGLDKSRLSRAITEAN
jgi:glutamyl-tRNA synthetase